LVVSTLLLMACEHPLKTPLKVWHFVGERPAAP
jgi:hypothetical protein